MKAFRSAFLSSYIFSLKLRIIYEVEALILTTGMLLTSLKTLVIQEPLVPPIIKSDAFSVPALCSCHWLDWRVSSTEEFCLVLSTVFRCGAKSSILMEFSVFQTIWSVLKIDVGGYQSPNLGSSRVFDSRFMWVQYSAFSLSCSSATPVHSAAYSINRSLIRKKKRNIWDSLFQCVLLMLVLMLDICL